jgi:GNAT superfamily N-acetyltransferase
VSRHPAKQEVVIREVASPTDRALGRAHGLLKRTFHRTEMVRLPDWRETLRERAAGLWTDLDWHLFVAERRGKIVGAAAGSYVGNVNVGLVGYVAVLREVRGQGVGDRLRRGLHRAFVQDARRIHARPLEAVIGEVHADNPWLAHLVRERRALALDFPYFQPSLHRRADPVNLVLYVQPTGRARTWLPAEEVRQLVYAVWRRIYRIDRPLSRPSFRRMLRALKPGTRVGARRLASAAESPDRRQRERTPLVVRRSRRDIRR